MPDGVPPSDFDPESRSIPSPAKPKGVRALLARLIGPKPVALGDMLQNGDGQEFGLSAAERAMIERIMAFETKRVDDVAIPRADIVGIPADANLPDMLKMFSEANHSRLPVYRGDLDDPIGMIHIKDIVGHLAEPDLADKKESGLIDKITREILYVPPSMPVTELLLRMQASRIHMALVIDEFGGTDGLVTIEDLIELIVGDIRDEHDPAEEFSLKRLGPDKWGADSRVPLEDLAKQAGDALLIEDEEADTIGGLAMNLAGRVPLRGEVIVHPGGYEFDIVEADPRTVHRLVLRKVK